jgi:hypothetical protein
LHANVDWSYESLGYAFALANLSVAAVAPPELSFTSTEVGMLLD